MNILFFILFNIFFYFLGRGFLILFNINNKNFLDLENFKILNTELKYFYPIFSFFVLGNIAVLLNFLIPVKSLIYNLFIFLILMLNFKFKISFFKNIWNTTYFFFIPFFLAISAYGVNLASDAGLYHLNTQNWIRFEKIHFGLINLHTRYGYSSIFDYIVSNFWNFDNLIYIHFINLSYILCFFFFLYKNIFKRKNSFLKNLSYSIILFGILDNFGINGGKNGFLDIEAITKYDTPFAIIYFFLIILIIEVVLTKKLNYLNTLIITLLFIYLIQLRIFGFTLVIIYLYYVFQFLKKYYDQVFKPGILLLLATSLIWFIKNLLITGCLIFPVNLTCFYSLKWSNKNLVLLESGDLGLFHINYQIGDNLFFWIDAWLSKEINKSTITNYLISLLLIVFLIKLLFKSTKNIDKNLNLYIFVIFQIIFSYFIWMLTAPGIRFALGLFISTFAIISLNYQDFEPRLLKVDRLIDIFFKTLFFISLVFLLRISYYSNFFNNFQSFITINVPEVTYKKNQLGWGSVNADLSSGCWGNIYCLPESKVVYFYKGKLYNYFSN